MKNNYYDENGFYLYSLVANPNALVPKNANRIDLPVYGVHERPRWNGKEWYITPDFKGRTLYHADGTRSVIEDYGIAPPPGTTVFAPPKDEGYTLDMDGNWIRDIAYVRNNLLARVQSIRVRLGAAGFSVNGIKFDSDTQATLAYGRLLIKLMMDPTFSVESWKASAGLWVHMDYVLLSELMEEEERHQRELFAWQGVKEIEIKGTNDIVVLEAIEATFDSIEATL